MVTLMIQATYEDAAIEFPSEMEARSWAKRYMTAFPNHKVWLVEGKAERIKV